MADTQKARGERLPDIADEARCTRDRRSSVADRRLHVSDRRQSTVDRRGPFADRRGPAEAQYRAPLDTKFQARLAAVQESERRRIAADLHDSIGSSLCTVKLKLQDAMERLRQDTAEQHVGPIAEIVSDVGRAMEEVRRIAMDLRPSILDDLGIVATIAWLSREVEHSNKGIRVEQRIGAREEEIPATLKAPIFRILQEAVNNAMKHSGARALRIALTRDADVVRLAIEDDGRGFDVADALVRFSCEQHCGIDNLRQRANSSGGSLTIKSTPGAGASITCVWPLGAR